MTPGQRRRAVLVVMAVLIGGCDAGGGHAEPSSHLTLSEAWRWEAPSPASVGMPASDGREIAATFGHHRLVLLDLGGRVRWEQEWLGLRDVAPTLTDTDVVAATDDGVVALDRRTGARRWVTPLGQRPSTPVVGGGRATVTTWEGALASLDLGDGRVVWTRPLPGGALGPPVLAGDTVVATWEDDAGSAAGAVALDAATGAPRWSASLPAGGVSAPAAVYGAHGRSVAAIVAGDARVHALDLESGAVRWTAEVSGAGSPEVPPAAVPGGVVAGDRLTGLARFDADGRRRWARPGPGAAVRGGPATLAWTSGVRGGVVVLPVDEGGMLAVTSDGIGVPTPAPPGRVSGVAAAAGRLVAATREARPNAIVAYELRLH